MDSPLRTLRRPHLLVVGLVCLFVLISVACRWDRRTGWTSLIGFGADLIIPRLAELEELPIKTFPGSGYDGQFYAQLAIRLDPRDPALHRTLDNPPYRSRRILLSALAYAVGGGDPWRILQVYALINVVCWIAFAGLLLRLLAPLDERKVAIWVCSVLSIGVLDSVRLALTDLPALLAVTFAIWLVQRRRPWAATGILALAGLVRDTVGLSIGLLWKSAAADGTSPRSSWLARLARFGLQTAVVALPVTLWLLWIRLEVPGSGGVRSGQLGWPMIPLVQHFKECIRQVAAGEFDGRYTFGILGALGLVYQAWYLLSRPRWQDLWWRAGAPFAVLLWFFGGDMWLGYWGAARSVLPMTLAYNMLLPRDRWFWWRLIGANLFVLHAIWRFVP